MDKVWYYMKSDRLKYGPYSDGEMIALIRQGILEEQDYIWMTYLPISQSNLQTDIQYSECLFFLS